MSPLPWKLKNLLRHPSLPSENEFTPLTPISTEWNNRSLGCRKWRRTVGQYFLQILFHLSNRCPAFKRIFLFSKLDWACYIFEFATFGSYFVYLKQELFSQSKKLKELKKSILFDQWTLWTLSWANLSSIKNTWFNMQMFGSWGPISSVHP